MYYIFTKSWRVFFYIVLAFTLYGYEARACVSKPIIFTPYKILPDSIFTEERITVEESAILKFVLKTSLYLAMRNVGFMEMDLNVYANGKLKQDKNLVSLFLLELLNTK